MRTCRSAHLMLRGAIPKEHLGTIYKLVRQAIDETNPCGKSTDEIFGEIYTRLRTSVMMYGHDDLKRLFAGRIKKLNGSEVGDQINQIINELYAPKKQNEHSIINLELCTAIMQSCLKEARDIDTQSQRVMSRLSEIDHTLNGGRNE